MATRFFCTLLLSAFFLSTKAQTKDTSFQNEWLGIDTLIIKQDLSKTALTKVDFLYQKAKKQSLPAQIIKCLIYQYTLQQRVTDNDPNLVCRTLQKEITNTTGKAQLAILHALMAKAYKEYFEQHRWEIYNRKKTTGNSKEDIATWSNDDFTSSITNELLASLNDPRILMQISLASWDAIIISGDTRHLRPTLFDLLAHEALDYFKSGVSYLTKPAYAFTISSESSLGTMADFVAATFPTKDSSSQQWLCLKLMQELMLFHQNDTNNAALLDINLERIEWVYKNAVFPQKEKAYLIALKEITNQKNYTAAVQQAWYLLAKKEASKASLYQPFGDTSNRYGYRQARQIAEKILAAHAEINTGTASLNNLLQEINKKELSSLTEHVNIPGKPFRALIRYRNIDTLYARIVPISNRNEAISNTYETDNWKKLTKLKSVKTYRQYLPAVDDHQLHSSEIRIESLPVGEYMLLCSSAASFNPDSNKLAACFFSVSNISFIKNNRDYFVVNRETGKPLPDVQVAISQRWYDDRKINHTAALQTEKTTDQNGYFRFDESVTNAKLVYVFSKGSDKLTVQQDDYFYLENTFGDNETEQATDDAKKFENSQSTVFYFTDRSIYRPGQTVYFKGIAITKDFHTQKSKIITRNDSAWIYLNDANGKKIDSLKYALNDYGSFNGKFMLPQNVLTGNFSISVKDYNQASSFFSVEEYKRPLFSVILEKTKGAYRLNDSVIITGYAKAFAGNTITGAKGSFTIKRSIRFRQPGTVRNVPAGYFVAREIEHGEIKTDESGKFLIRFKALADDLAPQLSNPLLDFTISAIITDINGETHSSNTTITAGKASLLLTIQSPELMEEDSAHVFKISCTNLSYEKEPATVHLKIYQLQSPDHPFRKRYWNRPDQHVLSREEFTASFPTDEYEAEADPLNWEKTKPVWEDSVNTENAEKISLAASTLPPGYYQLEAITKDKYGEEINNTQYIQLFNSAKNILPAPVYQFNYLSGTTAEPGQAINLYSGCSANEVWIIRKTDRIHDKDNNYSISNSKKTFDITRFIPTEEDRGGFVISENYVFNNRLYSHEYQVDVPWTNKKLTLAYASFRNKTEPGSKENMTVTVTTGKGEKAAAELVTGMYDASLDQFKPHQWFIPAIWEKFIPLGAFTGAYNFGSEESRGNYLPEKYYTAPLIHQDHLASKGNELWNRNLRTLLNDTTAFISVTMKRKLESLDEVVVVGYGDRNKENLAGRVAGINLMASNDNRQIRIRGASSKTEEEDDKVFSSIDVTDPITGNHIVNGRAVGKAMALNNNEVQIRKNFNETAFFFPQLYPDSSGKYSFSFTMPDALTQWKWQSFAHTKELAMGGNTEQIITQKKMMVQTNAPRFMREGDQMEFSGKIVNLSEKEITGQVSFELIDATTNTSVDGWFQNVFPSQYFTVEAGQSFPLKFPIQVPFSFNRPLTWRIIARSGEFSDGEENTIPVLTNRMPVTESMPLFLQNDTTQSFHFNKLLNTTSESLSHESLTIEYTANPAWYAVQALPYLMEYPYECAEQTFNRLYANTLGSFIVNSHPAIKKVFDKWKTDSLSSKSNLQKNEELKQVLLQESPWVLQAENEEAQKKNLAVLFDLDQLSSQTNTWIEKISQLQLPDGSFSWFKGGQGDPYMTNYILTGIGKLKRLGALSPDIALRIRNILVKAIQFADNNIRREYEWLVNNSADLSKPNIYPSQIEYLYMRSFFRDIAQQSPKAFNYFYQQGRKFWIKQNNYYRAELGLVFYRNKEENFTTHNILPALLESSVTDTRQGIYWKNNYAGYWYQSPVEFQSMMISFFTEIDLSSQGHSYLKQINGMKTWLLLNKQTNNWKTTIATADACYALLLNGSDWLASDKKVLIRLGNYSINNKNLATEAGTGYFKKRIDGKQLVPEMGNITVTTSESDPTNSNSKISQSPGWGAVYWQYFEDLDKVTPSASPLSINKKLFLEKNTDQGKLLVAINENDELKTGDKIVIRIELKADRDMDYLHLKDLRAASMEPVNVLSGYKWQGRLGYYESTKDVSSNFFISHLEKGTYVFEYPVYITHTGFFAAGLASIQCMYAPEFTSHSEGIKIRVVN